MEKKYEQALELRNQIASIELLTQHQVVDHTQRYDQDVVAFKRVREKVFVVQLSVRKGVLLGKQEYSLDFDRHIEQDFLKEFYSTRPIPREILINKTIWRDLNEKVALEEYFSTLRGAPVRLIIPKHGNELQLLKLAEKNININLDEDRLLKHMQASLNLPTLPRIIECFDVSNLGAERVVSGMVRFTDGRPDKRHYRRFKIKTVEGQDDFASINETVTRRYRRLLNEASQLPDLIVVDGGTGQVSAAKKALTSLGLQIPLIGLAKKKEDIFLPAEAKPRHFNKNSGMMLLLRRIRDSAHHFSLNYSQKRREINLRDEFKTH